MAGRVGYYKQRSSKESRMRAWRNWQTRTVQVRMGATPWRFKSSRPHHFFNRTASAVFLFLRSLALRLEGQFWGELCGSGLLRESEHRRGGCAGDEAGDSIGFYERADGLVGGLRRVAPVGAVLRQLLSVGSVNRINGLDGFKHFVLLGWGSFSMNELYVPTQEPSLVDQPIHPRSNSAVTQRT